MGKKGALVIGTGLWHVSHHDTCIVKDYKRTPLLVASTLTLSHARGCVECY